MDIRSLLSQGSQSKQIGPKEGVMGKASWWESSPLAGRRWAQPLGRVILVSFLNKGEVGNQSEGVASLGESPRGVKLKWG